MAEYASLYIDLEIIALTIDYETNNRLLLEIYIDYKFELIVRLLFKIPQRSLKKKEAIILWNYLEQMIKYERREFLDIPETPKPYRIHNIVLKTKNLKAS